MFEAAPEILSLDLRDVLAVDRYLIVSFVGNTACLFDSQ
jgi:hypothetical protein